MRSTLLILAFTLMMVPVIPGAWGNETIVGTVDCYGTLHITFSPPLGLVDQRGTFGIPEFALNCYGAAATCKGPDPSVLGLLCAGNMTAPVAGSVAGYYGNCARAFLHDAILGPKSDPVDAILLGGAALSASIMVINTTEPILGTVQGILVPDDQDPCGLPGGMSGATCTCTLTAVGQFG